MRAATLEATALTTGGAAIRFQLFKPGTARAQCVVDREMMMNMNLDSSGGLPHNLLGLCGPGHMGGTHYYWRHANGGADASNLKTGGTCTAGFPNRVSGSVLGVPVGRLPHGHELPNHLGDCTGADGKLCTEVVRYNAISDVEECCEACRELRFLDATPDFATNPCLAFQIVQGKCHVARQKLFTTRWPKYSGTVTITVHPLLHPSSFRTLHVHHGTHIARSLHSSHDALSKTRHKRLAPHTFALSPHSPSPTPSPHYSGGDDRTLRGVCRPHQVRDHSQRQPWKLGVVRGWGQGHKPGRVQLLLLPVLVGRRERIREGPCRARRPI